MKPGELEHYQAVEKILAAHGLLARGGFRPGPDDGVPGAGAGTALILVGNAGPAMWQAFSASPEYRDGAADPLDRWTRRVVADAAARFEARALFPFEGPPHHPFQRWAMKAEGLQPSPIGPLIHPVYGLWHAYRAALIFDGAMEITPPHPPAARVPPSPPLRGGEGRGEVGPSPVTHPCDTCAEKPCLAGCPVDAWHAGDGRPRERFDIPACVGHISRPEGRSCMEAGCRARRACPVGCEYTYEPPHAAFHMAHFRRAQIARGLGAGPKSD